MEVNSEQVLLEAQTAEAEEVKEGATQSETSLGKFKDVTSLLKAYNSLQSEFTKRCQRVKELEGALASDKAQTPSASEGTPEEKGIDGVSEQLKTEIVKEYLKGLTGAKQTAVLLGNAGASVKTPAEKPKTIEQAGTLAKKLF